MFKSIIITILASFLLVSCGEPNSPEDYTGGYNIVKKVQTYGDANDVIVDANYAYVTQGEGGLAIFNIDDPKNPILVKSQSEGLHGYSTKLIKKENILFIAAGSSGFNQVDVSNPSNPLVRDQDLNGKLVNLHVMGDYLIGSVSESGFHISFMRHGMKPLDYRGYTHTNGFTNGVTTTADESTLFAATGEMGLSVYNISNFDDGYGIFSSTSSINLPGYAESVVLNESLQVAFVACGSAGLQVVDYSDTSNMHVIGSYDTAGYAQELLLEDNKIYLTASGLQVFDVSSPSNPKLLGIVDTEYALGVTVDSNYIYVADKEEGLIVIKKK